MRALLERGDELRILVRPDSNVEVLPDVDMDILEGDVTDREDVVEAVKGCERVFHLGGIGAGQVGKICNNLMFTVNLRTAFEALRLANAAGIDEKLMREITSGSTANSWSLENIDAMREMMRNRRQSRDSIAIGNKDLSLAADLGRSLGIDTPIAAFVSDLDITGIDPRILTDR